MDYFYSLDIIENPEKYLKNLALSEFLEINILYPNLDNSGLDLLSASFYSPSFVLPAMSLKKKFDQYIHTFCISSTLQNDPIPKQKALDILNTEKQNWKKRTPSVSNWYIDDKVIWKEIYQDIKDTEVIITFKNNEHCREVHTRFSNIKHLHDLVSYLNGLHNFNEITDPKALLPFIDAIQKVNAFTLRKNISPISKTDLKNSDFKITNICHAFLIIECENKKILIDPWIPPHHKNNKIQPPTINELGHIDAILYTHHHSDHFHIPTLLNFKKETLIIIPKQNNLPYKPNMKSFLNEFGFVNVVELSHSCEKLIGDSVRIVSLPFFGEGLDEYFIPANCYLISHSKRNILVHADASPNNQNKSLLTNNYLKNIVNNYGSIQVVFASWWQEKQFLYNLEPFHIFNELINSSDWLDSVKSCYTTPQFINDLIVQSQSNLIITYAEGGEDSFRLPEYKSQHIPSMSMHWESPENIFPLIEKEFNCTVVKATPYLKTVINTNLDVTYSI